MIIGKLHDEVRAPREGQSLAPGPDLAEEAVADMDLGSGQDRHVDMLFTERAGEPCPGLVEHAEIGEIEAPLVQMRRPGDMGDTVVAGDPGHRDGMGQVSGPVVQARQDMAVEVDHPWARASFPALPPAAVSFPSGDLLRSSGLVEYSYW